MFRKGVKGDLTGLKSNFRFTECECTKSSIGATSEKAANSGNRRFDVGPLLSRERS